MKKITINFTKVGEAEIFTSAPNLWGKGFYREEGCKASLNGNLLTISGEYIHATYVVTIDDSSFSDYLKIHKENTRRAIDIYHRIAKLKALAIVRYINTGV